jgi:nucleotide-binding universal stress UspA family protein
MRPIRRILVAVRDPAAKTLPAVYKAAQLARAYDAHLELFHAISAPLYVDAYSFQPSLREIEREIRSSRIGRHLLPCHPIAAIERTARKTHSAIVVMGAISRSGLRRSIFGNTAEYLLESLPCDLLIVKPPKFSVPLQKRSRGVKFVAAPYLPAI